MLAVVSDEKQKRHPGAKDDFRFLFQRGAESGPRVQGLGLSNPWVEAAVAVAVFPKENDVHVDFFNRNEAQPSSAVHAAFPESTASRLLMCFALALGAYLLRRAGADLQAATLSLEAADRGDFKLINYYHHRYGLRLDPWSPSSMEGSLLDALQLCTNVWKEKAEDRFVFGKPLMR